MKLHTGPEIQVQHELQCCCLERAVAQYPGTVKSTSSDHSAYNRQLGKVFHDLEAEKEVKVLFVLKRAKAFPDGQLLRNPWQALAWICTGILAMRSD